MVIHFIALGLKEQIRLTMNLWELAVCLVTRSLGRPHAAEKPPHGGLFRLTHPSTYLNLYAPHACLLLQCA